MYSGCYSKFFSDLNIIFLHESDILYRSDSDIEVIEASILFLFKMTKLVNTPELEVTLKTKNLSKIKNLHKLIFENDGDRTNRQRICEYAGFSF